MDNVKKARKIEEDGMIDIGNNIGSTNNKVLLCVPVTNAT